MTEEQLRQELQAVYSSNSWKITKPLRNLMALLRGKWRFRIAVGDILTEEQLRWELQAVYSSNSWKITQPLRNLTGLLKRKRRFRISFGSLFFSFVRRLVRQPWLRKIGSRGLMYFPALRASIRNFMVSFGAYTESKNNFTHVLPDNEAALSPNGLAILAELRLAVSKARR